MTRFDGNSDYGSYLIIAQAFEPKENDAAVNKSEPMDSLIQLFDLQSFVIGILERVDVDIQGHPFPAAPALFLLVNAAVKTYTVYPCPDIRFILK